MKLTIGIDIGTKNLSLCAVGYESITSWMLLYYELVDTKIKSKENPISIINIINRTLDTFHENIDKIFMEKYKRKNPGYVVVVENQPGLKCIMERVMMAVISYYMTKGKTITAMNSNDKWKVFGGSVKVPRGKSNYAQRKSLSIEIGKKCIEDSRNTMKHLVNIDRIKKDDLFDSLIMALRINNHKFTIQ